MFPLKSRAPEAPVLCCDGLAREKLGAPRVVWVLEQPSLMSAFDVCQRLEQMPGNARCSLGTGLFFPRFCLTVGWGWGSTASSREQVEILFYVSFEVYLF